MGLGRLRVSGRPPGRSAGADLSAAWRRWDDLAGLFAEPIDAEWDADRDLIDASLEDPWEAR
jgi:hypothetical protein